MEEEYNYQDWIEGKLTPEKIKEVWASDKISQTDYLRIRKEQEEAYLYWSKNILDYFKVEFHMKYLVSLVREELLEHEISVVAEHVLLYKKIHNQMYKDTLEGKDDRFNYTEAELEDIDIDSIGYCPLLLIVNLKYLRYLSWIKDNVLNVKQVPNISQDTTVGKTFNPYISPIEIYDSKQDKSEVLQTLKINLKQLEWLGPLEEENQILDLYKSLTEARFIECSSEVLLGVFQPFTFLEPVKWLTNNASELIFFILKLQEFGFSPTPSRQDWQTLRMLFIKGDGSFFKENFKTLKTDIKINW